MIVLQHHRCTWGHDNPCALPVLYDGSRFYCLGGHILSLVSSGELRVALVYEQPYPPLGSMSEDEVIDNFINHYGGERDVVRRYLWPS